MNIYSTDSAQPLSASKWLMINREWKIFLFFVSQKISQRIQKFTLKFEPNCYNSNIQGCVCSLTSSHFAILYLAQSLSDVVVVLPIFTIHKYFCIFNCTLPTEIDVTLDLKFVSVSLAHKMPSGLFNASKQTRPWQQ